MSNDVARPLARAILKAAVTESAADAEIAMLIGDKSGPAIIALTYGDVRPDHLLKQAQRIRLTVQASSNKSSIASPDVSRSFAGVPEDTDSEEMPAPQGF